MMTLRPAGERGHARFSWLDSYHTFSFGHYYDPAHMGVSILRVINDDTVAPGAGFPTHGHRDMEIVTYVLSGALEHKDSMGNGSVIRAGDVQRMSAGTGVLHSEYNASQTEPLRLLQIWLLPNREGVTPGYEEQHFDAGERRGRLRLLVSPDGRDGSISAHQDGFLYGSLLDAGDTVTFAPKGRCSYVHVARGRAEVNGHSLAGGDGARIEQEAGIRLTGTDAAEILLFDLP